MESTMRLLHLVDDEIKKKRAHLAKKKVLFHQGDAPLHTAIVAMDKIKGMNFELLPHPPYLPCLASSDFYLFPELKKMAR